MTSPDRSWPRIEDCVMLQPFSTLGVGGPARWFVRVGSVDEVAAAHRWCEERRVPMFVLGGGSNLVIADDGFDGLVVQVAIAGVTFTSEGDETRVTAGAGESWDAVVSAVVARGLAGVECLSGIPGLVGGTPIQNVGAYGQEVADTLERVTVYDRQEERVRALSAADCGFAYRMSRFKGEDAGRFVVCDVTLRVRADAPTVTYPDVIAHLRQGGVARPTLANVRESVLSVRRAKGMVLDAADPDTRSVGSFFMNPVLSAAHRERITSAAGTAAPGFVMAGGQVKVPAAWLIEQSGFAKGMADGRAGISSKHPLALVNRGGATAGDVIRLAVRIKRAVGERFGVWLRPEPVFVGCEASADVAFLQRAQG